MKHCAPGEVVVSRGILYGGGGAIEYHTSQPSPSQWIALSSVRLGPAFDSGDVTCCVLVGNGETEDMAIDSLRLRLNEFFVTHGASLVLTDFASWASRPSDWFG